MLYDEHNVQKSEPSKLLDQIDQNILSVPSLRVIKSSLGVFVLGG
jgi:hypothetical protein